MASVSDLFQLFELTPDLVCIAGKDGYFRKINNAVIEKLGYTEEELFSRLISSFVHPDDREETARTRAELIGGQSLLNFENRYITKNGAVVWLEWTSIYHPEKELVFAIAKDITKRKIVEKDIEAEYHKFKSLASHFKTSMEADRKFLAAELHEEMAQLASVIRMDIDWVVRREDNLSPASINRMEHAAGITELLIATIRRITFSIGSTMLGHVGLKATLDWQCREFALLSGVPCKFLSSLDDSTRLGETELDFLRICQEALTSIMMNTEVRQVGLALDQIGGKIYLTIQVDYKVIINRELFSDSLDRIRDRASYINGQTEIELDPESCTIIRVIVDK